MSKSKNTDLIIRPRMNALLSEAIKAPLTIVCAGTGCGKTRAVRDFIQEQGIPTVWLQFAESDNDAANFWKKYNSAIAKWDAVSAKRFLELGFPDTEEKLTYYLNLRKRALVSGRFMLVLDNFHLVKDPGVLHFLNRFLHEAPRKLNVIMIGRKMPKINIASLQIRGLLPNINEEDLNFNENEITDYLLQLGLTVDQQSLRDILQDTGGWALSVNLIARSLKKSRGYSGYVRCAMKQNLYNLIETEQYASISERLRKFLTRLSLVEHFSGDLVNRLLDHNRKLQIELELQNAYIRFDEETGAYALHPLFLNFLRAKQHSLTDDEVRETFRTAAEWCGSNGYTMDALRYFERIQDYRSIFTLLSAFSLIPYEIAYEAAEMLGRAPAEALNCEASFVVLHIRILIRLGRWNEALERLQAGEAKLLAMEEASESQGAALGRLYCCWGYLRTLMSTTDGRFDFDEYFAKMDRYYSDTHSNADIFTTMGAWTLLNGSAREGAPQDYIQAVVRSVPYLARCGGAMHSMVDLCRSELLFYQGDIRAAESAALLVREAARESGNYAMEYKALFYLLRIAVWNGKYEKAERVLEDIKSDLSQTGDNYRFLSFDIATGWYLCALRQPDAVPVWLKEAFEPYGHACYIENFGNLIKARYCYLTKNFQTLLPYLEEACRRESVLQEKVEMLALKACVHFQMKNKPAAMDTLRMAYETASPNSIMTPFAELGKDMRTLAAYALREAEQAIPSAWLETVKRLSSSYAKRQSLLIADYKKARGIFCGKTLSSRESEILSELYHGHSRSEIAAKNGLSINTVNSAINNIFDKMDAHSVVDVIRIAAEQKLV